VFNTDVDGNFLPLPSGEGRGEGYLLDGLTLQRIIQLLSHLYPKLEFRRSYYKPW